MTITNWIAIVTIIAALMNPFITDWLARKRAQELLDTATPATNQPNALMKRLRKFFSSPKAAILIVVFGIPNSIYVLIKEANDSAPLSRRTILTIGFHLATILFLLLGFWVTVLMLRLLSSSHRAMDIADSTFDRMKSLLDLVEQNQKALNEFADIFTDIANQLRAEAKPTKGFID